MTCPKCNVTLVESKAIVNALKASTDELTVDDLAGATMSFTGEAILTDCLKCPKCGYSVINLDI